jgi:hypothetical protein
MKTLRTSATDLDALRYFMAEDDGDLDKLLRQLRRQEPATEAMQAGTAFHAVLEGAGPGELRTASCDGFTFDFDNTGDLALPEIREMKATREYRIGDVIVTIVGKVDAIHGSRVYDHKLTGRVDVERYMESVQWRVYAAIFGANMVVYNLFEKREVGGEGSKHYVVGAPQTLRLYRYPELDADVEKAVAEFVAFARQHLPERFVDETIADQMIRAGSFFG